MITKQHKTTTLHRLWMPVVTAAFIGYFGFHAFSGSYGLRAMEQFEQDQVSLTLRLGYLRQQRRDLEEHIAALRPEGLDPEVVDSHARTALNLIGENEIVLRIAASQ